MTENSRTCSGKAAGGKTLKLQKPEPCGICEGPVIYDSTTKTISCNCSTISTPKTTAYYRTKGWK